MRLSFKSKALLVICPIIVLISIAYTLAAIRNQQKLLRDEIIKRGEILAAVAAKSAELPLLAGNPELIKNTAVAFSEIRNVPFVTFFSPDFKPLVHEGVSAPLQPPSALSAKKPVVVFERDNYFEFYGPVFSIRPGADIDMYDESTSTSFRQEHIGWVRIGLSKEVMQKTTHAMARNGALFALLLVAVAITLVTVFLSVMLHPLNKLFDAARDLQEGEYPQVPQNGANDEIGQLSAEFNKMSAAIKEREQQLLNSQKRISELFQRVEHAIFRLDRDFKVVEGNLKFKELFAEDVDFFSRVTEKNSEADQQAARAGRLIGAEVEVAAKDGTDHTIMLSMYPDVDEQGTIYEFDGHFVDITEKKRLEEALHQTQKMESLGLLAGGIAHDFNNILTGIMGYTSLLKAMLPTSESQSLDFLEAIEKSSDRAANLVKQLLGFARKGKIQAIPLDVNIVIKELVGFLRETFDRKITITLTVDKELPLVEADATQIYQAFMNLCINARDSMPDGGKLSIVTEHQVLDLELVTDFGRVSPGDYVLIQVIDSGKGMGREVKSRVFEPFFTTKEKGQGTGLGLSMVYGIIKNHNGHIVIYSEEGHGSAIHIYLPAVEAKANLESVEAKVEVRGRGGGTVLLIDDEETVRELGRHILESNNYTVLLAPHGREGVKIYREKEDAIDLVILDMIMPVMGGKETFHAIREINPHAPVLLCSGYSQEEAFGELLQAGARGFIPKPFRYDELLRKVEELLPASSE
jgi:signal transduction histidine kinase/CheY-like chemotaxis protein/HAMP domain-containing protein